MRPKACEDVGVPPIQSFLNDKFIASMKREKFMVAAIQNGTVIDHIPSSKLFEVVRLLHLEEIRGSSIMVGYNLKSRKMGHKSIIKVSQIFYRCRIEPPFSSSS